MLRADDISVHFGGVAAVNRISFELTSGEVLGIVGPNGSGKSTLLNALSGLVDMSGTMSIRGHTIPAGKPRHVRRAGLLRTFQTPQAFTQLTCIENVMLSTKERRSTGMLGALPGRPWMWQHERQRMANAYAALERVGLHKYATSSAVGLAYGQIRYLEIARAIAGKPEILAMDEPSAGLNQVETTELAILMRSLIGDGITLLVVDHKIDFLQSVCDRLIVLQLGQVIAEGRPDEVFQDPAVIDAYLGV